jgi:pimeloyl-ACP methyl ester carboxylesterase
MTMNDLGGRTALPFLVPIEQMHIGGHALEVQVIPAQQTNRPTLVFLHEGLGCIATWRGFPARVASATGCQTVVYSRRGYGNSEVLPDPPFPGGQLHHEALQVLPELLGRLGVQRPVLVGHSDGASIALIHAGAQRWETAGVVAMAPHVFVEEMCIAAIEAVERSFRETDLRARLGRHHRDPEKTFRAWCGMWLDPAFRTWSIEDCLPAVRCPILAIQGYDDEYASMEQLARIAAKARNVELLELADCRHSPFRDQPEATLEAVLRFVTEIS